jgi:hypothetical protein
MSSPMPFVPEFQSSPFLQLFQILWMLSNRQSTLFLKQFSTNLKVVRSNNKIITPGREWDADLDMFLTVGEAAGGYRNEFMRRAAIPMLCAYRKSINGDDPARFEKALEHLANMMPCDWQIAAQGWINHLQQQNGESL